MLGKVVLITGADGGIGRETTLALATRGATTIMACIDLNDARPVYDAIKEASGNPNLDLMCLNLASRHSIREFVKQFSQKYQQLHLLINNAGVFCMHRETTEDGFEKTMGTNYLGPFLLTNLLLPLLSKPSSARIVNVASNAYLQGNIDLHDLHMTKKYHGFKAYASSKLAIVLFTIELSERLRGTGITVNALHPGHAATNIWNMWAHPTWYQKLVVKAIKMFLVAPREAAQHIIYLACSEEVEGTTGRYFDKKKIRNLSAKCMDAQLRKSLWQLSEKETGLS